MIEPLWVGKYEVTWAEYEQYMKDYRFFKAMRKPQLIADATFVTAPTELYSVEQAYQYSPAKDYPACAITQFAARQYTKWLSLQLRERYRLPTQAEWMYACCDGDLNRKIDKESLPKFAVCETGDAGPNAVGTRKPTAWGLHDTLGNVSEWVIDAQAEEGNSRRKGKQSVFDAIQKSTTRFGHKALGGSWMSPFENCTVFSTEISTDEWWELDPTIPLSPWWLCGPITHSIGFRIVRPLREGTAEEWTTYWEPDSEELKLDVETTLQEGRGTTGRPQLSPRFRTLNPRKP